MKLENQVCTIEQGKRLQELGTTIQFLEPYFCHIDGMIWPTHTVAKGNNGNINWDAPAYTVAELGEMLPSGYDTMWVTESPDKKSWRGYDDSGKDWPTNDNLFPTEAQARAAMLIYLLENNLLTP